MSAAASTARMSSSAAAASAMNTTASTSPAVNLSLQNGAGGSMSAYLWFGNGLFFVRYFLLDLGGLWSVTGDGWMVDTSMRG